MGVSIAARLLPLLLNTGNKQRLSILIYHRIVPEADPMRPDEPTAAQFACQMRLLREHFTPLPLLEATERLQSGTLPERAVCVTFDDGYADNATCAQPILQQFGIPWTLFVSTSFLNGGRMFNDTVIEALRIIPGDNLDLTSFGLARYSTNSFSERVLAAGEIIRQVKHLDPGLRSDLVARIERLVPQLPRDLMLDDKQLRALAASDVCIGAHTITHPILASVSEDTARHEIVQGKQQLEKLIQADVDVFAYPNGRPQLDYLPVHRNIVEQAGFRLAVSTHWGVGVERSDRYQLPRFTPWDRKELRFALRLFANLRNIDPLVASAS